MAFAGRWAEERGHCRQRFRALSDDCARNTRRYTHRNRCTPRNRSSATESVSRPGQSRPRRGRSRRRSTPSRRPPEVPDGVRSQRGEMGQVVHVGRIVVGRRILFNELGHATVSQSGVRYHTRMTDRDSVPDAIHMSRCADAQPPWQWLRCPGYSDALPPPGRWLPCRDNPQQRRFS